MLTLRPAKERGITRTDWLESHHSFSFADYRDPAHVHFGPLRVINEDFVAPGAGFPMHGHSDMEIITWIISGALEHKDSLGNGAVIRPGEVQAMSAGKGVLHSEFNPSETDPVHLLQIWIMPDARGKGTPPAYGQQAIAPAGGGITLVASGDPAEGGLYIRQNARVFAGRLPAGGGTRAPVNENRKYWIQLATGAVSANGTAMKAGDGLAVSKESGALDITAAQDAEFLLFDMA